MPKVHERSGGDRLGQEDDEVRAAIRFAVLAAVAGVGFVIMAAVWVSTCGGTERRHGGLRPAAADAAGVRADR